MSDNNGWPGEPGVPRNPEEPGYHWVLGCDGENTIVFWRGHGGDTHHENGDLKYLDHWRGFPMWMAQDWTYLGPCPTPAEEDARIATARKDAREEAARRILIYFNNNHIAQNAAAAIRALANGEGEGND